MDGSKHLDYFLLKPVESQFIVSFRYVKSYALVSIVILLIMLTTLILDYSKPIGFLNVLAFVFSFLMGTVLWYSVDFIISSSCFWFKNFSVSGWLSHEILKFSTRPDSIYTGKLRKVLFSIVPMIFIASIPTRTLLYGPNVQYLSGQIFMSMTFLFLTQIIWKRGLMLYESASS